MVKVSKKAHARTNACEQHFDGFCGNYVVFSASYILIGEKRIVKQYIYNKLNQVMQLAEHNRKS